MAFIHCLARDPDKTGVKKSLAKVCDWIIYLLPFVYVLIFIDASKGISVIY